ncbi:hypothetical protein BG006_010897 [Podila minutissima]|uniref:Uncharacterized protein n=1 Tax=Podila minutissima TaxID=64525 RepID=A0A9P5SF65_9FUNG|nr:hypothetical protein BG006_010897 [Podila minutissima]
MRDPEVFAKAASESYADTTFRLTYFPFHGHTELTIVLVLIDAKTEPLVVVLYEAMPPEPFLNWQSPQGSDALANYYSKVLFSTPNNRHKEAETFYSARFSRAAAHETHLQEYFNHGHFIGVVSLADMRTTQVMQLLKLMLPTGIKFPALPTGLAKLMETVEMEFRIAA